MIYFLYCRTDTNERLFEALGAMSLHENINSIIAAESTAKAITSINDFQAILNIIQANNQVISAQFPEEEICVTPRNLSWSREFDDFNVESNDYALVTAEMVDFLPANVSKDRVFVAELNEDTTPPTIVNITPLNKK